MASVPPPLAFVLLLFSGWANRNQQAVIAYLLEENRVLRAANGSRRLRLTDDHDGVSPRKARCWAVVNLRQSLAS